MPKPPRKHTGKLPPTPRRRSKPDLETTPRIKPSLATARHAKLLDAGLKLISERGVAGASLRLLAESLGMSQPSLYHYFESKEDLVSQIVNYCAQKMLDSVPFQAMPDNVLELPDFVVEGVMKLWCGERHPRFTRFLFVVAIENPVQRRRIERVFREQLYGSMPALGARYSDDPREQLEIAQIIRMIVGALGLALLEERALFGLAKPSATTEAYAAWLSTTAREQLASKLARPARG